MSQARALFDVKHQTFQILTLRMVDVNRVVGRLCELVQNTHLATGDGCCRKYGRAEQLLRYGLRAGERKENASLANLRHRASVEPLVALQSVAEHLVMLGECRWVEDNHIVFVADIFQVFDCIARDGRVCCSVAKVERDVCIGQANCSLGGVNRAYLLCTARQCIYRETTRVTEGVEYGAACGVFANEFAVETLVDKETGLLALLPIYEELVTVLQYDVVFLGHRAVEITIHRVEVCLVWYGLRALVVNGGNALAEHLANGICNLLARTIHTDRVTLHNSNRAVDIDYQARQRVALAVNESVAGRLLGICEVQSAANVVRAGNLLAPPRGVNLLALEREHAYGNRADLVVAASEKIALFAEYIDNLAFGNRLAVAHDALYRAREYPRVASCEGLLFASSQKYLWNHTYVNFVRAKVRKVWQKPI